MSDDSRNSWRDRFSVDVSAIRAKAVASLQNEADRFDEGRAAEGKDLGREVPAPRAVRGLAALLLRLSDTRTLLISAACLYVLDRFVFDGWLLPPLLAGSLGLLGWVIYQRLKMHRR